MVFPAISLKRTTKVLIIVGAATCLAVLTLGVLGSIDLYRRLTNPYLAQEISGPRVLSDEWLEIVPDKPLRPERIVQEIIIYVDKPVTKDRDFWDLVLPDGSRVTPEVELVDEDGNIYKLTLPSAVENPNSIEAFQRGFGLRGLPKDKVYRTVRIKSAKPVKVLKIVWRCYDPRDIW
jgi:hypothetical protein